MEIMRINKLPHFNF